MSAAAHVPLPPPLPPPLCWPARGGGALPQVPNPLHFVTEHFDTEEIFFRGENVFSEEMVFFFHRSLPPAVAVEGVRRQCDPPRRPATLLRRPLTGRRCHRSAGAGQHADTECAGKHALPQAGQAVAPGGLPEDPGSPGQGQAAARRHLGTLNPKTWQPGSAGQGQAAARCHPGTLNPKTWQPGSPGQRQAAARRHPGTLNPKTWQPGSPGQGQAAARRHPGTLNPKTWQPGSPGQGQATARSRPGNPKP